MLVLGRKPGEEIVVGGDVRITVVKVDGQTVRLGIAAPADVRIDRAEISKLARSRRAPARRTGQKLARAA
jgi:carbon storage regulator